MQFNVLNIKNSSIREILKDVEEEEHRRMKWTLFGNEAEKMELDVIRTQHLLRTRVDKVALQKLVCVFI